MAAVAQIVCRGRLMLRVREINDVEELAGYRPDWDALLRRTEGATFFQSLAWLEVFWRHFGREQTLRVLVVSDAGTTVGILPLVVSSEATRLGPFRVLTYPLHDWGTFYGPIGPQPAATLLAGLKHVAETTRDWELLDLRWVDRDGADRRETEEVMRAAGFPPSEQGWARAAVIRMDCGWDDYWQSRPRKWRENAWRDRRRIGATGRATYLRYRPEGEAAGDADPRWDLYDACLRIAAASWQGSAGNGTTLSHDAVKEYLRDTHLAAVRSAAVDMNLLAIDGVPVAFAYNYRFAGSLYGLRMGYDPKTAPPGAGAYLERAMIEDSFRRGDRYFDLGVGSLYGKRHWKTGDATSYRYTYFPATVRGQIMRLKRWFHARLAEPGYVRYVDAARQK
jgi:CelD/BcsL family acetyltransferase involved in cellulose biosynthesis